MRNRYKNKLKSCPLCKPHKRCLAVRWRPQVLDNIIRAEREVREADIVVS